MTACAVILGAVIIVMEINRLRNDHIAAANKILTMLNDIRSAINNHR